MSDSVEKGRGQHMVVRFDGRSCMHSRNCPLGRPDLFVPNMSGESIHPDRA